MQDLEQLTRLYGYLNLAQVFGVPSDPLGGQLSLASPQRMGCFSNADWIRSVRQLFRFGLVGCLATGTHLLVFFAVH